MLIVCTNKLVKHVEGIDGLKTGWTRESGYNLTATMKKDGMRLVSVVMGSSTSAKRNYETVRLLNYGFGQYKVVEYRPANYLVGTHSNMMLSPKKINVVTKEPIFFVLEKGEDLGGVSERFSFDIDKKTYKKGDVIGEMEVVKDGKVVYTVPLVVDDDVHKANFFELLGRLMYKVFYG